MNLNKSLLSLFCFFTCSFSSYSQSTEYYNGLFIERVNNSDTSRNRYTRDNLIFKHGYVFIYDYYYLDASLNKKKFQSDLGEVTFENPMGLVDYYSNIDEKIDKIKIIVTDDINRFLSIDSSYSQTVFEYSYMNSNNKIIWQESTGVIDNNLNLWIHPPRYNMFKILQINPYPFVIHDNKKRKWSWSLKVGENWSDSRWKRWENTIKVESLYQKHRKKIKIDSKLGVLKCTLIEASAFSTLGNTSLKIYYHQNYGFVKLEYINIDGSTIILELIEIKK